MRSPLLYQIALAILVIGKLNAQSDVSPLRLNRLLTSDLMPATDTASVGKVLSGTRNLQNPVYLPIDMYVVTKEDILRTNCIPLADVLKTVPGFRVSQPGSAEMGEMFLMRGLLGNAYTRILINDVPIRPGTLRGMPLGAQLPIRQAERIEIVYGPAADLYDPTAIAGVINIILQQTERPAYVEADLFAGVSGYTDINVSFGGKIGTSKRGLRYRLYGSHTRTANQPIDISTPFELSNYPIDSVLLSNNPNFVADIPFSYVPYIGALPYESRQLGIDLQWRGWQFAASTHYRRDHSALGHHPGAISYADNGTFTGESISQLALSYSKNFGKRFGMRIMMNTLNYELDPQGSVTYLESSLLQDLRHTAKLYAQDDMVLSDSLGRYVFNRYFSGRRYASKNSFNFRLEPLFFYQPFSWLHFTAGLLGQLHESDTRYFRRRPYVSGQIDFEDQLYFNQSSLGEQSAFAQVYAHKKWWSVMAGYRLHSPEFGDLLHLKRFGLSYWLWGWLKLRAGYGEAASLPFSSYDSDSYTVENYGALNNPFTILRAARNAVQSELFNTWEFAMYCHSVRTWEMKLSWHRQSATHLIAPLPLNNQDPNAPWFPVQIFANQAGELYWEAWQWSYTRREIGASKESFVNINIQRGKGREVLPDGTKLPFVREMPRWLIQANIFARITRGIHVQISPQYFSGMFHRSVTDPNADMARSAVNYQSPFFNVDLTGHLRITDQVQFILKMRNVTGVRYAGLSGGGPDDLLFNPQRGRTTFVGLSYRMN